MSEIDPQKLELLRTALPKGLSAGDSGLTQSRSTSVSVASFPEFTSKVSESKLYTPTLEQSSIPEISDQARDESSSFHPWKITIRTDPEAATTTYLYAVESSSRLFNGFGGIAVDVVGADGVFRPLEEGFYFIEVNFTDGEIDQAEIKIAEDMGASVETSGGQQTKLKQQIGYIYFEDEVPKIRQYAWHNYSLFDVCRDGGPVKITIAT